MKLQSSKQEFVLNPQGIDAYSEYLNDLLAVVDLEARNCMRIRLSTEEALLRLCDHFGEEARITVFTGSTITSSFVRIEHVGSPYNPLSDDSVDMDGWMDSLFTTTDISPRYARVGNKNVLRLTFRHLNAKPLVTLLVAIVAGVAAGLWGNAFVPDARRLMVTGAAFDPLFDMWENLLNVLAAPVVSLMTMATMLNTQMIERQGGNRHRVMARYFLMSFAVGAIAVAAAACVYRLSFSGDVIDRTELLGILQQGLVAIIPRHIVDPFITSNTPQLLLIAVVLSNALMALGERAHDLTNVVRQASLASMLITSWVSTLVPVFVAILLALEIWNRRVSVLLQMWHPLLLSVAVTTGVLFVALLSVSVRYKVGLGKIMRKVWKPFAISVETGTLDDSYGEAEYSCVNGLGINKTFTTVTLPQGLVLYMPAHIMGTLIFIMFVAHVYHVQTTALWFVTAVVLDVLLFVATPPVPGANLLAFIAIFHTLGIPQEAFLDAMLFDIVFGIFASAVNQTLLQVEMIRQSDRLGMLDRDKLRM